MKKESTARVAEVRDSDEDLAERAVELQKEIDEASEELEAIKDDMRERAARAGVSPFLIRPKSGGEVKVVPGGRSLNLLSPDVAEKALGPDFGLFCKLAPKLAVNVETFERLLATLPDERRESVSQFITVAPRKATVTVSTKKS